MEVVNVNQLLLVAHDPKDFWHIVLGDQLHNEQVDRGRTRDLGQVCLLVVVQRHRVVKLDFLDLGVRGLGFGRWVPLNLGLRQNLNFGRRCTHSSKRKETYFR
jgi:hypothetical protein